MILRVGGLHSGNDRYALPSALGVRRCGVLLLFGDPEAVDDIATLSENDQHASKGTRVPEKAGESGRTTTQIITRRNPSALPPNERCVCL